MVLTADWDRLGKGAGIIRNSQIIERCTSVLAFWDGVSRGTLDSITKAIRAGKAVRIVPASVVQATAEPTTPPTP